MTFYKELPVLHRLSPYYKKLRQSTNDGVIVKVFWDIADSFVYNIGPKFYEIYE